jgi:hypothetical protein
VNARRVPVARARPHRFRWNGDAIGDGYGALVCRCGSLDAASVHRGTGVPATTVDAAALAAPERDDDDLAGVPR